MNKDRIEGKVKDVTGRVERQAGEWTDDPEMQVKGTVKQVEGKIQNAVGQAKDAAKDALKRTGKEDETASREERDRTDRRKTA